MFAQPLHLALSAAVLLATAADPVPCVHDQVKEQVPGECMVHTNCSSIPFLLADDKVPLCEDILDEDGDSLVCCPKHIRPDYINRQCVRYLFEETLRRPLRTADEHVSKRKCREYADMFCYETTGFPATFIEEKCDLPTPFVLGGVNASLGEFPHMALLGYEGDTMTCGGSLISERYVLTAAHCVSNLTVLWVKLGLVERSSPDAKTLGVEEIRIHPEYRGFDNEMYNDIALIKLNASVDLALTLRPVCLHTDQDPQPEEGRNASVVGWGKTRPGEEVSNWLMWANLPFVSQEACKEDYRRSLDTKLPRGIVESQFCSGKILERDAGQGDSGGPLLINANNDPYCSNRIVGIVSLGREQPGAGDITIFTRVATFVPWIESIVWS